MTFHVELLPDAESDLDQIFEWLSKRSPQGAATWYRRWLLVLDDLEARADSYAQAPEDARHELDLEQVIFKTKHGKPYRAIFTITKQTVFVFCIRAHGQELVDSTDLNLSE